VVRRVFSPGKGRQSGENAQLSSAEVLTSIIFNTRPARQPGIAIAAVIARLQRKFSTEPNKHRGVDRNGSDAVENR
jgi:hypothetical protein